MSLDLVGRALADHIGALPVVAAVEHHEHLAGVDAAERIGAVALPPRQPHPEHVYRCADVLDREAGALAHHRAAAVGADHEHRADFELTVRGFCAHAGDAAAFLDQAGDLGAHMKMKCRVAAALLDQEIQQVPLRHQRDELAARRQVGEIRDPDRRVADHAAEALHPPVRQLQELLQQAKLVDDFERGRMDGVAAEVAQEVGVLLQHHDVDAGARQQQPQHHAGGTAAGDAARGGDLVHRTPVLSWSFRGRPTGRSPESILPVPPHSSNRGYGFRTAAFAASGMTTERTVWGALALQPGRNVLVLALELHAGRQRHGLHHGGEVLLQVLVRILLQHRGAEMRL